MPAPDTTVATPPDVIGSRDPAAITVLRSANGRRCAKHFVRDAGGVIAVVPYDRESHWIPEVVPCPDFATFIQALTLLSTMRDRIIVRGQLREMTPGGPIHRRCIGSGAHFSPALRSWVALDVDGLPVSEPYLHYVFSALPPRFHNVACFYQFTSSYGVMGELTDMRVRLWYRLSHPMSDAAWKRTLRPFAQAAHLDLSLYNPVQPHYIAEPTFEGMADPLGQHGAAVGRSGVHDPLGAAPVVDVSDIPIRDELDEATTVVSALTRTGIDANPDQINQVLNRFATRTRHASRHATAVALIGELYGHGLSGEEAMRHANRYMVQQGRPPERGELERALQFVVRRAESGQLRTNETPIGLVFDEEPGIPVAPDPLQAAENEAANEEAVEEWPSQPNALARRTHSDLFHSDGFVRWGKADFEWATTYWRPMSDDEELAARIQRAARCTPGIAARGAEALRNDQHRAHLRPPCLLVDGTPIAPRVCVRNGWLSVAALRTAGATPTLAPYSPDVFETQPPMPVTYNPEATCPHFERALDEWFLDDPESRGALIRLMGYLLFKGNEYQRIFICSGAPASGKSTWQRVMRALLGPIRGVVGDMLSFGTDYGLASIYEAQALFLPEASHGDGNGTQLSGPAIDQLKRISGGDPVLVRRKYKDDVTAEQMPTPVVICNNPATVRDEAFIRRMVTVHFPHSFVGREDPTLTERLLRELDGIFNVALRGLAMIGFERDPFPPPSAPTDDSAESSAARDLYERVRADASPLAEFARRCLRAQAERTFVGVPQLHAAYRRWCAANNYRPLDERQFSANMSHVQITGTRWTRRRIEGIRHYGLEAVGWSEEGMRYQSDAGVF